MSIEHEVGEFFSDPLDLPPTDSECRGLLEDTVKLFKGLPLEKMHGVNERIRLILTGGRDSQDKISPGFVDLHKKNEDGLLFELTYYSDLHSNNNFFIKNLVTLRLLEDKSYALTRYKLLVDKDVIESEGIDLLDQEVAQELQRYEAKHEPTPEEVESIQQQVDLGLFKTSRRDLADFKKIIQTSEVV